LFISNALSFKKQDSTVFRKRRVALTLA